MICDVKRQILTIRGFNSQFLARQGPARVLRCFGIVATPSLFFRLWARVQPTLYELVCASL